MLIELVIENIAIIDHLHLRLESGLTVLTGETGAGKSIIIDALQAALGSRVGSDAMRSGAAQASVEAVFEVNGTLAARVAPLLQEHGIEPDDLLILRREIKTGGRTIGRINGRAVPLSLLVQIGDALVDIHGQSDHLSVLRRDRQLDAVDHFGDLMPLRESVREAIQRYRRSREQVVAVLGGQREAEQRIDLLRFQVGEIEAAELAPGEEESAVLERTRLVNAERLAQLSSSAYHTLRDSTPAALEQLDAALDAVQHLAGLDGDLSSWHDRLMSARYEVEDIAQELRGYRDRIEDDPRRLQVVEDRMDLLARLRRKYGATIEDVIAFGINARIQMQHIENRDLQLIDLHREARDTEARAGELAAKLSVRRQESAARLTNAVQSALAGLGMRGTGFQVKVSQTDSADGLEVQGSDPRVAYGTSGFDTVAFLVSFNPGEPVRPLERVASGGEISRFLLALKSVLASADSTPTLVFDEVDVGVGARHGMAVAQRLHDLGKSHQVISITHLPQIAAVAAHHINIRKANEAERTSVSVRVLDRAERVAEIAQMMSGSGTERALRTAEELLETAEREV